MNRTHSRCLTPAVCTLLGLLFNVQAFGQRDSEKITIGVVGGKTVVGGERAKVLQEGLNGANVKILDDDKGQDVIIRVFADHVQSQAMPRKLDEALQYLCDHQFPAKIYLPDNQVWEVYGEKGRSDWRVFKSPGEKDQHQRSLRQAEHERAAAEWKARKEAEQREFWYGTAKVAVGIACIVALGWMVYRKLD